MVENNLKFYFTILNMLCCAVAINIFFKCMRLLLENKLDKFMIHCCMKTLT